ncbi:TlyA family RNA methyltransferase [Actinotalea ferrariae]|uniref:TlyA family RNA methyltransferase n=1 Tax=Actinotalea ferrariae TaxID=1386098 RepID=UPI001C8C7D05|nr:TlyA family RNA methyltransferase [Actinotalea ferrariae]MBX9245288.1 TlyA family RNA methyltransferase [Actinotalea ferrariae]
MTTAPTRRLDAELVRRGLVRSRTRGAELVSRGHVRVDGEVVTKSSFPVPADATLEVGGPSAMYVSRAAHKLAGALDALAAVPGAPDPRGRWCLDAGASTGGFTQVLLERGAEHVLAIDVGHGQMDEVIAADPRVTAREGLNVRGLTADDVPRPPGLVVADLSFISLTLAVGPLLSVCAPEGDLLLMVKPQFEVGRDRLGRDGVVTSVELRHEAVVTVADAAGRAGATVRAVVPSPLPGPSGNHEYFLWLRPRAAGASGTDRVALRVREAARRAVVDGVTAVVADELHGAPRTLA